MQCGDCPEEQVVWKGICCVETLSLFQVCGHIGKIRPAWGVETLTVEKVKRRGCVCKDKKDERDRERKSSLILRHIYHPYSDPQAGALNEFCESIKMKPEISLILGVYVK